MKLPIV